MNRPRYYKLDGHKTVPADQWEPLGAFEDGVVAKTHLPGDIEVSTVFLGLDHNWGDGPPLLFETMVFGGPLDQEQERWSTWDEAEAGHRATVERAKGRASNATT